MVKAMGIEIERKFLISSDAWRSESDAGSQIVQGYLPTDASCAVRVRVAGDNAWLTIKGSAHGGVSRAEYEYAIPVDDAHGLLSTMARRPYVEKCRFRVLRGTHTWEIDVFEGDNLGLVVAEIELSSEAEAFARPDWLGAEVSADPRYSNAALVKHPYSSW